MVFANQCRQHQAGVLQGVEEVHDLQALLEAEPAHVFQARRPVDEHPHLARAAQAAAKRLLAQQRTERVNGLETGKIKEFLVGLIAHNLLRCVMAEAAWEHAVPAERISFKGTLDGLRQFGQAIGQARGTHRKKTLWAALLLSLARDLVPERPSRREPRAVKRRPKYQLLRRPRHQQRDRPRRSVRRTRSNAKRLI